VDTADLDKLSHLSPFELKNRLIELAASHAERVMLNAGRGNPNFLATAPRHGFFQLGLFAMGEAERCAGGMPQGVAGLPNPEGIARRFEAFAGARRDVPGIAFLVEAVSYAHDSLGIPNNAFLHELVQGVLGCNYPEPVRMLRHSAEVVRRYLVKEMIGGSPLTTLLTTLLTTGIDLFAVEGGTAGITYAFNSLRENKLLAPGDVIAIGMPIFAPYIEIPRLNDYRLIELAIEADPEAGWQYPDRELDKLLDPRVKAFLLVNPGNPSSVKINPAGLTRIAQIVESKRPDLIILTDDVYATFADDFVSLFALCPRNTILVYSFSKYFGATGWRLGVIATSQTNVLDAGISALPECDRAALDARYGSLVLDPRHLKFIDRLAADSRAVALNHTAGLSTPQQIQMALFALFALIDEQDTYKQAMKHMMRGRHRALYRALGIDIAEDANAVDYYTILDLEIFGARRYGHGFVDWLLAHKNPLEILFCLADEAGIVLLPGKGFGTPHPSARVSLANLNEADYARIGRIIRSVMEEYAGEYRSASANEPTPQSPIDSAAAQEHHRVAVTNPKG
jgi:aspartate 4-decarboxylase